LSRKWRKLSKEETDLKEKNKGRPIGESEVEISKKSLKYKA